MRPVSHVTCCQRRVSHHAAPSLMDLTEVQMGNQRWSSASGCFNLTVSPVQVVFEGFFDHPTRGHIRIDNIHMSSSVQLEQCTRKSRLPSVCAKRLIGPRRRQEENPLAGVGAAEHIVRRCLYPTYTKGVGETEEAASRPHAARRRRF